MFESFFFSFSTVDEVARMKYRTSVHFTPADENKVNCHVSSYSMDLDFDDPYNGFESKDECFDSLSDAISFYLKKYEGYQLSVQGKI